MMILKITPSIDYNYWLKHLDIQTKIDKRKRFYIVLGSNAINSTPPPPQWRAKHFV